MVAVLAHEPLSAKNKTSSSPTSSRCTTVASRIKSWKEGARRALDKSFRLTNKALNDVLHGVTSKTYRPVTKQASPSSRFSTGAGTKQSQSIEPGIFLSQFSSSFIGAGTQQSQYIEAGTQQPQTVHRGRHAAASVHHADRSTGWAAVFIYDGLARSTWRTWTSTNHSRG